MTKDEKNNEKHVFIHLDNPNMFPIEEYMEKRQRENEECFFTVKQPEVGKHMRPGDIMYIKKGVGITSSGIIGKVEILETPKIYPDDIDAPFEWKEINTGQPATPLTNLRVRCKILEVRLTESKGKITLQMLRKNRILDNCIARLRSTNNKINKECVDCLVPLWEKKRTAEIVSEPAKPAHKVFLSDIELGYIIKSVSPDRDTLPELWEQLTSFDEE